MSLFMRVLLFIYAFCLTIISGVAVFCAIQPDVFYSFSDFMIGEVLQAPGSRLVLFLIALTFFILSMVFLLSGLKNEREKRGVSKFTNIGEIRISLNSIENIALSASRRPMGVRESKAYVHKNDEGVSVTIRLVALPDINLPSLSEDVQHRVKSAIEEASGIRVNEVKVIVDNIHTGYKSSRVE